jgi:hypothetical protein
MKKLYIILLAAVTVAFMFSACQKPSNKPAGKDKDNDKEQQDQQGGDSGNNVQISIDGNFADWDAITESVANNNDYVDMFKAGSDDPIQVIKIASDPDNIYFYFEFTAELLPQNEACGTWGSSFSENALDVEMGDDDEEFREVMHLFIDPDGKGSTGFLTFEDPEKEGTPAIGDLGSEMCAQFFMYFKPSTGNVCVAFEQTLIGPTKVGPVGENDQVDGDYTGDFNYNGTFCQGWPDEGEEAAFPLWGWQNFDDSGAGDNDCPRPDNWKSGKLDGSGVVKVEFSLDKDDIVNLKDSDEELACGVIFDWDNREPIYQATGVLRVSYAK